MRAKIQAKVAAALSGKLVGATQMIVLKREESVADKIKGTFIKSVSEYKGRGICRLSWSAVEMNALNIPQADGKAIILQSEIAVKPKQGDLLDFGDGDCQVVHVTQDPVQAIWVVQYRKV